MTRSEFFIKSIIIAEGGDKVTNDPNDSGGLTKFGISQKSFPKLDIRNLTEQQAIDIYKKRYCDPCNVELIHDELLAIHIFDFAVTSGVSKSVKTIQKIVGVKQDGVIGPNTLANINGNHDYAQEFIASRASYYKSIGFGKNSKFLKGWLNRIQNTTALVNKETTQIN